MSYLFGLGDGWLPKAAADVAERHDAELVNYEDERGHRRHWFTAQNLGEPFDSATARAVMDDLAKLDLGPLTVAQAAQKLGVKPDRVRKLIASGKLRARMFGSEYQIDRADLEEIETRKPGAPAGQKRFTITLKDGEAFGARTDTVENAAHRAAKRLWGSRATAVRTTGTKGLSGYFQGYVPMPQRLGGGLNSVGDPFHVTEA